MLKADGSGFVPLPRERILYTSPSRTSFVLQTSNPYPGKEPFKVSSNGGGLAFVTNQRVVYLPSTKSPHFESFSVPILGLVDSRVTAPWFGANTWEAVVRPASNGGIPPQHSYVEVKLTFKEGGAYDFHRIFEEIKERTAHAAETARAQGRTADLSDVPLEQLPAYAVSVSAAGADALSGSGAAPARGDLLAADTNASSHAARPSPAPEEPPPGYEEAQSASVMESFEDEIRRQNP